MENVDFPVEEIPDALWSPLPTQEQQQPAQPPAVGDGGVSDREGAAGGGATDQDMAAAEWSFERILEEALLDDGDTVAADPVPDAAPYAADPAVPVGGEHADPAVPTGGAGMAETVVAETMAEREDVSPEPAPVVAVDPVEYNAVLKRKLAEDLAAVAVWRTSGAKHPKSSRGSNNYIEGNGIQVQKMSDGQPGHLVQNAGMSGKEVSGISSREPSPTDDDDYGEVEILGFMMPDVEKVRKRKESNRESARRSRNRKAAHVKDLEDQVAQLRVENSSLLRRLAALNQKYNDATVDNRVLKADIETLKAQVKMATEAVKRFTGMCPLPTKPVSGMPFTRGILFHGSTSDANNNASAPIQDYFATTTNGSVNNSSVPNLPPSFQGEDTINGSLTARKISRIPSQHAMALEDLNNAMCGMATSPGSAPWSSPSLDPNESANMEMH